MASESLGAGLVARGIVAKVLAHALSDPDPATRAYLDGPAHGDLRRASSLVSGRSRMRPTLDGLAIALIGLREGEAAAMFAKAGTPPYETEYGMAHVFMKVQTMADVAGFYRAFGLRSSDDTRERPDHVAAEIEFLHFLLLQEAHARAQGRSDAARTARRARASFVREHLATWAPPLLEKAAEAGPRSAGAVLLRIASRFLRAEAVRLRVPVSPAPPAPNPPPRPERERALCEPPSQA